MNRLNLSPKAMSVRSNKIDSNGRLLNKTSSIAHPPSTKNTEHHSNTNIFDILGIIKINFPAEYESYLLRNKYGEADIRVNNFEQQMNKILYYIKIQNRQKVEGLQSELNSLETELKLVRESRNIAEQKLKSLEKQAQQIKTNKHKSMCSYFDQNQQIFKYKNKIQLLEKQMIKKSLAYQQLQDQFISCKNNAQYQVDQCVGYQDQLEAEVKRACRQVQDLQRKLEVCLSDNAKYQNNNKKFVVQKKMLEEQNRKFKQKLDILHFQCQKYKNLYSQAASQCKSCQRGIYRVEQQYQPSQEVMYSQARVDNLHIHEDQNQHNMNIRLRNVKNRTERPMPKTEQLLAQVKQLRENQSMLIDRLAERDKIIQNLSNSISHTSIIA